MKTRVASPPTRAPGVVVDPLVPAGRPTNLHNSTRSNFAANVLQLTPETGNPQSQIAGSGSGPNDRWLITPEATPGTQLVPYGSGVEGGWFEMHGIGHAPLEHAGAPAVAGDANPTPGRVDEWVKRKLFEVKGRLSARTGVAGMSIDQNQRFVSELTIVNDYTAGSCRVVNAQSGGVATLTFDRLSNERVEVQTAVKIPTGESGTAAVSMNILSAAL